jgi:hypothetical protein
MDGDPQRTPIRLHVPDGIGQGVYANVVAIWHTAHDFTLDFAVAGMPQAGDDNATVVPAEVVARVKVPTSVIFQIAQAIATNVDSYERSYGPLTPRP